MALATEYRQMTKPEAERFMSFVAVGHGPGACWTWLGGLDEDDYGIFTLANRTRRAARLSRTHFCGPVNTSSVIDHVCRNRPCVRPDHLEPVSNRENIMRGSGLAAMNAAKLSCAACGRGLCGDNLMRVGAGGKYRKCRSCAYARNRAYHRSGLRLSRSKP